MSVKESLSADASETGGRTPHTATHPAVIYGALVRVDSARTTHGENDRSRPIDAQVQREFDAGRVIEVASGLIDRIHESFDHSSDH